jgi:GNAT superfamily N-acetyltransferase
LRAVGRLGDDGTVQPVASAGGTAIEGPSSATTPRPSARHRLLALRVRQLDDQLFWPELTDGQSAFVHRLAVRRRFAGTGVSLALLSWSVEHARRLGKLCLRLDCDHQRTKLRSVYERFGFRLHSYRQVGPYYVARYEYPLG